MSFYDVIMRRRTDESEAEMARRVGQNRATFRLWQIAEPMPKRIHQVALRLGEKPGDLFEEYMEDYLLNHRDEPSGSRRGGGNGKNNPNQ